MLKNIVLAAASLLLISCGQKITRRPYKVTYINSSDGRPILLGKRKEGFKCPSLLTSDFEQQIIAPFYSSWKEIQIPFLLPVKSRGGLVKSSIISKALLSGKLSYLESTVKMKFEATIVEAAKEFRVCPGYDYSKEDTYDAATAGSLYSFKEVEESFKLINLKLAPIKLRVAPLVEHIQEQFENKEILRKKRTLVNNAFYFGAKNEIIFLPQGKNKKGEIPFSGVPLWKIPFVGAHEYGHHLFNTLMPNYINDKKNSGFNGVSLCFNNVEEVNKEERSEEGSPRTPSVENIMSSINEGVADLLARTILNRKFNLMGVGCFEYTRDVEKKIFANGQAKRLDKEILDILLLDKRAKSGNCYEIQDFQDPHIIGAIVAHGLFQLYEQADLTKKQRLQAIVEWLRQLNMQYHDTKKLALEDLVEKSLYTAVKVVTDKVDIPQAKLCKVIADSFPMIDIYYGCK